MTKTLKRGPLTTQRDVTQQCRDTKKAQPKQESQDGGEGRGDGKEITGFIEMTMGKETEGSRLGQMLPQ